MTVGPDPRAVVSRNASCAVGQNTEPAVQQGLMGLIMEPCLALFMKWKYRKLNEIKSPFQLKKNNGPK